MAAAEVDWIKNQVGIRGSEPQLCETFCLGMQTMQLNENVTPTFRM